MVASAVESEIGGILVNAHFAIPIRHTIIALENLQSPTPLKTENSTAYKFAHNDTKQRMSKSWDIRYNWLRDRSVIQKLLDIYWDKGTNNLADYFTKYHAPAHHKAMRPVYIHSG